MKQDNEKETDNTEPAVTYHVACHGENSRIRAWWLRQAGKSKVEQDKSRHQGEKNLRLSQESWKNTHLVVLFKLRLWRKYFSSA